MAAGCTCPFRDIVPKFQSSALRDFHLRTCCFFLCGQHVIPVAFLYRCMHIQILQYKHIVLGHVWSAQDVHMPLRTKRMWLMSLWSPSLQQTDLFQVQTQRIQPGTTTVCTAQLSRRPFSSTRRKLIWSWPQKALAASASHIASYAPGQVMNLGFFIYALSSYGYGICTLKQRHLQGYHFFRCFWKHPKMWICIEFSTSHLR